MNHPAAQTGATLLIDSLAAQGVDTVFCVPGESYLAAMDALYDYRDQIKLVVCRHEGSATFMAEAHAKATGRPGICFVTRAPGATQASIGLHTAHQDSTPLILFVGQVGLHFMGREAFQEVDYRQMFQPVAKWVAEIADPARVPEMVNRAFHEALSGRRGPVVLALPENVLSGAVPETVRIAKPANPPQVVPSAHDLKKLQTLLEQAQRPLVVLGGSGWNAKAVEDMGAFLRHAGLPVICSFRRQDLFDNNDEQYVGVLGLGADPALQDAVKNSDLLVLLGARMGEVPSCGYTLIDSPQPQQLLVHCMPCAKELGRVYRPDLAMLSTMPELAQELAQLQLPPDLKTRWKPWVQILRQGFESFTTPKLSPHHPASTDQDMVDMGAIWQILSRDLPDDVIITNGAGNYTAWAHRFYRYTSFGSQLAPTSGAMGYGLPAAIGGQLAHPQRPVLCLAGDGCFMMSSHEMATAVKLKLPIVTVVFDNQMYGTIRMHQEKWFPERVYGTALDNPDFVALGRAYGAHAQAVHSAEELMAAILVGFKANGPTLLHVRTDPEQISPGGSITSIREKAKPTTMARQALAP
jgi:acetolactate synthase-1/2/3 large subunit